MLCCATRKTDSPSTHAILLITIRLTIGMAVITSAALVNISCHIFVFIVHFGLIVFMAINAFKNGKICLGYVTVTALIPFIFMRTGINGEVLAVMIPGGLIPTGGIVAILATGGKTSRLMVGIGGVIVVILMTTVAVGGGTGIPVGMAILAL